MGANGFREEELVSRKVKVGDEWQNRTFPVVGGRLRIVHETNSRLSIKTEIIRLDVDFVVAKAIVENEKGTFAGTGTASIQRDARLADSLVEPAETRVIARALRFGGIGVEYVGAEEVNHVAEPETERSQHNRVSTGMDGNGKPASVGQVRLLYALAKQAELTEEDKNHMLTPLGATHFNDLTCQDASRLITYLKTQVAA